MDCGVERVVVRESIKSVKNFMNMVNAFPDMAWDASGTMCLLSDTISKNVAKALGCVSVLDGAGVDVPDYNIEVTAGKNISKSHGMKNPATFVWVKRHGNNFSDGYEIRIGEIHPSDFPTPKPGKHGVSVPKSIAMDKTKVVYTTKDTQ